MALIDTVKKNKKGGELRVVYPAVAIREEDSTIILEAEMPSLEKENITIEVMGDELVISGKRPVSVPKGATVLYQERLPVEYREVFSLSSGIDRNTIQANYENGVVSVTLAKAEKAQPKRITIS